MLNGKKKAFERHNRDELKCIQNEMKTETRKDKEEYEQDERKTERNFKSSNMNRVWGGMKLMSGYERKKGKERG